MLFSPEFKIALTKQVFENSNSAGFHDVAYEIYDFSFDVTDLKSIFMGLPEEIQITALRWGLEDTQFRDDAYRELEKWGMTLEMQRMIKKAGK